MGLFRQIGTLFHKNILIALFRHPFTTALRAFILPIVYVVIIVLARSFVSSPSVFGIGTTRPVRSLLNGFTNAVAHRDILAFVNNGHAGGDIDKVIRAVSDPLTKAGETVHLLSSDDELKTLCKSSWRAVSHCYGAAVFHSSPTEGKGGIWNYTIEVDGALGSTINVLTDINEVEIYPIPIQHAVDFAIASLNKTVDQKALPTSVNEYLFTTLTLQQRADETRIQFVNTIVNALAVVFFVGMIGIVYQLTGFMATEREQGMSQLLEAMMPNLRRWQPQVARLASYFFSFSVLYIPAWLIMSVIMWKGLFTQTPIGIMIVFQLLQGLALASFAILGASFFNRSQVSGITVSVVAALFAIIAQILGKRSSAAVIVLSLLFAPSNYVYFIIYISRFEINSTVVTLGQAAPGNPWNVSGSILLAFTVIQIVVYPILGALVERWLYGTASSARTLSTEEDAAAAVEVRNLEKIYTRGWLFRKVARLFGVATEPVVAVRDLSFTATKGEVVMLLGANGSGKSTTMDAIVGLHKMTGGSIHVDGKRGLGYCPQQNVAWDLVTVEEHISIFNKLKTTGARDTKEETRALIKDIGLEEKRKAKAKTLSGGQKRKLQLGMMYTGGSSVCCVDEISSGLDPLSRRKVWDIILKERGTRTFIMSTHFLDEADALADNIIILSKGSMKVEGSSVALKTEYGGGYRVQLHPTGLQTTPQIEGSVPTKLDDGTIVYSVPGSAEAARLVVELEDQGIYDYEVAGPSMEDVFLKVAGDVQPDSSSESNASRGSIPGPVDLPEKVIDGTIAPATEIERDSGISLMTGRPVGFARQAWVLFGKRWTISRRNFLPLVAAFAIPVIAGGLVTRFLDKSLGSSCAGATYSISDSQAVVNVSALSLVVGPPSRFSATALLNAFPSFGAPTADNATSVAMALLPNIHTVNTLNEFNAYINANFSTLVPGGFFLGESVGAAPTFAYLGTSLPTSIFIQNMMNSILTNVSITTHYSSFAVPSTSGLGDSLQLITYFSLALCAFPAFFALYPTVERIRLVRSLQYSNGVKPVRLWTAYLFFDWLICLASSVIVIAIFTASSSAWYHVAYLFPILCLYGLASTLLSYAISLISSSQLAAFAFCAGGQAVMYLVYIIAYFAILTFSPIDSIDSTLLTASFVISALSPVANVARALFIAVNVLSTTCSSEGSLITSPGIFTLYSGPIVILILQTILFFIIVVWWDAGTIIPARFRNIDPKPQDLEEREGDEPEIFGEAARIEHQDGGLKVSHLTKSFRRKTAVDNLTFGVGRGEVFALLGPNGAGKSTTISVIRGDIKPSHRGGDVFMENVSVVRNRASARAHLGVCPQYNAIDHMTVSEQLLFYAQIRGTPNPSHNVHHVLRAVDLLPFAHRPSATLSGGSKRKLALAIALIGNPAVLLLDEPSSGVDALAKRHIWAAVSRAATGRAVLLTSHSMEEVAALASRAGIMARRMLAMGDTEGLRERFGGGWHVHIVTRTAPRTPDVEMKRLRSWMGKRIKGARFEERTFHGQLRFTVSAKALEGMGGVGEDKLGEKKGEKRDGVDQPKDGNGVEGQEKRRGGTLAKLFVLLEGHKEELGMAYYAVAPTSLDEVFLTVVGKHDVEE